MDNGPALNETICLVGLGYMQLPQFFDRLVRHVEKQLLGQAWGKVLIGMKVDLSSVVKEICRHSFGQWNIEQR